jgi:hypothetical protein
VTPSGNYGSISEVVTRKAGAQKVSDLDTRTLVEYWKEIYNIDISADEIPLLKIKMVNSENTFTYPPSMLLVVILWSSLQLFKNLLNTKNLL